MKELDKTSEKDLKEMEKVIYLPAKEFKIIVHKDAPQCQENNARRKYQTSEWENTINELNKKEEFKGRWDEAEERITKLKG